MPVRRSLTMHRGQGPACGRRHQRPRQDPSHRKVHQQLNYVSIQVIWQRRRLSSARGAESFQKLYGDCKDKANSPAHAESRRSHGLPRRDLLGRPNARARDWPSLGSFNHAISAIRVSSGTQSPAILDHPSSDVSSSSTPPTLRCPRLLPDHEQGSLALLGAAKMAGWCASRRPAR